MCRRAARGGGRQGCVWESRAGQWGRAWLSVDDAEEAFAELRAVVCALVIIVVVLCELVDAAEVIDHPFAEDAVHLGLVGRVESALVPVRADDDAHRCVVAAEQPGYLFQHFLLRLADDGADGVGLLISRRELVPAVVPVVFALLAYHPLARVERVVVHGVAHASVGIHVLHRWQHFARQAVAQVRGEEGRHAECLEEFELHLQRVFAGDVGGEDVGVARRGLEGRYRIVVEHHQHVFQVGAFAFQGAQFQQDGRASLAVSGHPHSAGSTVQVAFPQGAGESHRTGVPEDEGVERETVAAVQVDIPADAFLVEGDI